MSAGVAQLAALCAAFWVGLLAYGRRPGRVRLAVGLGLGALCAHLGWALLHADALRGHLGVLLDPSRGFCVLFVPLGLLVAAPNAAAFRALPLVLATARLGCVAVGCCGGVPTALPWAVAGRHPAALYDVAGLVALHALLRRAADARVVPLALAGFGALRLGLEPLRVAPALGEPLVPVAALAGAWVVAGLALAAAPWGARQR